MGKSLRFSIVTFHKIFKIRRGSLGSFPDCNKQIKGQKDTLILIWANVIKKMAAILRSLEVPTLLLEQICLPGG